MKSKMLNGSIAFAIVSMIIVFGLTRSCLSEESAMKAQDARTNEAGNKICPISGEKIKPGKEHKVEYNGKVYNLCCSMCDKDFKKDPQAAIEKLEAMENDDTMKEGVKDVDGNDDGDTEAMPGMNQEMNK